MKTKIFIFLLITIFGFAEVNSQIKLKNNGFVGIGTLDPNSRLHVFGDATFDAGGHYTFRIVPGNPKMEIGSSTNRIDFWYPGEGYNRLFAKAFTRMSDIRLKRDIQHIPNCISLVNQLRPVKYLLLSDVNEPNSAGIPDYGFIAQEVEEVLPEVVAESGSGLLGIDYNALVPVLTGAIQEQQEEIKELKRSVEELQKTLQQLQLKTKIDGADSPSVSENF